jgi:hypothetical protein
MPVILATQEVANGKITVQGKPRQKFTRPPFLTEKAGCGGMYLSSQLCREHKQEDRGLGMPGQKSKTLLSK